MLRGISDLSLPMPLFSCVRGARRRVYFGIWYPRVTFLEGCSLPPPAPKSFLSSLGKQCSRIKGFNLTADNNKPQNLETCPRRNIYIYILFLECDTNLLAGWGFSVSYNAPGLKGFHGMRQELGRVIKAEDSENPDQLLNIW